MPDAGYPSLVLDEWRATRDTIHAYAKVIGDIRRNFAPKQKYWGHLSLRVTATGLTTRPFIAGNRVVELVLDFTVHQLIISTNRGEQWRQPLYGQSSNELCGRMLSALGLMDVWPELDRGLLSDAPGAYDIAAISRFWQVLTRLNGVLTQFRGERREETSPVEMWPEHFDLAVLWFSGRMVPRQDVANENWADEQMNFGFVTGDASVPEPYFYATAYPLPPMLPGTAWPQDVRWHSLGWNGAVMPYAALVGAADPDGKLLSFLRTAQQAGSSLMR
jgi:hypothetical protein